MEVYLFLYADCITKPFQTISIHKTKKGAYKAMRTYILDMYEMWYNERIMFGKGKDDRFNYYGDFINWTVKAETLND